jgi:hypothetical protein
MPGFMTTSHIAVHLENNEYMKALPDNWYSSDYYASKTISYLQNRDVSKPFFSYLPFTAPHWPLQAPKELIEHYRGVYKDGPEALRQARLKKMVELGLMDEGTVPHPVVGDEEAEWEEMSPEAKAKSSRAMEAYAGMVEVSSSFVQSRNGIWVDKDRIVLKMDSRWISILAKCWTNWRNKACWITHLLCSLATMGQKAQRTRHIP